MFLSLGGFLVMVIQWWWIIYNNYNTMWMWRYGGGVNSINIIEWCLGDGGFVVSFYVVVVVLLLNI